MDLEVSRTTAMHILPNGTNIQKNVQPRFSSWCTICKAEGLHR